MRVTIAQATANERNLSVRSTGYGQYIIECDHRGKRINCHSTDSESVDNFFSEPEEKNRWGRNRVKAGYKSLISECVRKNR